VFDQPVTLELASGSVLTTLSDHFGVVASLRPR
jgi:hypothetical protein